MVWPVELAPQSNTERRDGWAEFGPVRQAFRWRCLINVNVAFIAGAHPSAVILIKKQKKNCQIVSNQSNYERLGQPALDTYERYSFDSKDSLLDNYKLDRLPRNILSLCVSVCMF